MRRALAALVLLLALLAAAAPATAADARFSMAEIETELMCPTCGTRLDMSQAPAANQIRAFVAARRDEGWTKEQVKDALVEEYGEAVLSSPPTDGIGIAAWLLPAGVAGLAIVAVGAGAVAARRRARERREDDDGPPPGDDLDRRIDRAIADYDG